MLFKNEDNLFAFISEIRHYTKGLVLRNLDSLGFVSIAAGKYASTSTAPIGAGEEFDFLVKCDSIIETGSTIYKPINGMTALLSMDTTNISVASNSNIAADIFDNTVMNKFIVNNDITDSLALFSFVQFTPSGYSSSITADAKTRPMFGSHTNYPTTVEDTYDVYGNCLHLVHHYSQTTTYFFWIASVHAPVLTGTTQSAGTNC